MAEKFHHPHVDNLREAQQTAPGRAAQRLGRTVQRHLHRRVMEAARDARTVDPGWQGGNPPDDTDQQGQDPQQPST